MSKEINYQILNQLNDSVGKVVAVNVHVKGVRVHVCGIAAVIVIFLETVPLDHEFVLWVF